MSIVASYPLAPTSAWLKQFPLGVDYAGETVSITSVADLPSGTVLSKITATGHYTKVNTGGTGGNEITTGILLSPVKAGTAIPGVMLNKLTGCVMLFSQLGYTGTAATVKTALETMGARFAKEV